MRSEQKVPTEIAEAFAKEKNMLFFETSAKTAEHVNECFNLLTNSIVKELEKNQSKKKVESGPNKVDLADKNVGQGNRGKGYCC